MYSYVFYLDKAQGFWNKTKHDIHLLLQWFVSQTKTVAVEIMVRMVLVFSPTTQDKHLHYLDTQCLFWLVIVLQSMEYI